MKKILLILVLGYQALDACERTQISLDIDDKWRIETDGGHHAYLWCTFAGKESARVISTSGKDITGIVLSPYHRYVAFQTDKGNLVWDLELNKFAKTSIDPKLSEFLARVPEIKKPSEKKGLVVSAKIQELQKIFLSK